MENENDFVGKWVSVKYSSGPIQGLVKHIDTVQNTFTITNAIRNGVPCNQPELILRPEDIHSLLFIESVNRNTWTGQVGRNIPEDFITEHRETRPTPTAGMRARHTTSLVGNQFQASPTRLPNSSPPNTWCSQQDPLPPREDHCSLLLLSFLQHIVLQHTSMQNSFL